MYSYLLIFLCVNLITISFARSENDQALRDWFNSDWLKPYEANDSRPSWWFDVWGGDGMLMEGIITDEEHLNISKQIEILTLKANGETSRIKMMPINVEIKNILSISDFIKMDDLSLKRGGKTIVYYLLDSKHGTLSWNRKNSFKKGDAIIFFAERVGAVMVGDYYVKWTMDINRAAHLSEIIKARDLHLGKRFAREN